MGWVRSLSQVEMYYLQSVETGADRMALTLVLKTSKQLQKEIVSDTYQKLCRAAPNLCLSVDERDGKRWFRRTSSDSSKNLIFLDEPTVESALKHHSAMLKQEYKKSGGPLWHLKVIQVCQHSIDPQTLGKTFMSVLVFGFHHVITDETTNLIIAGHFLTLLKEAMNNQKKSEAIVFRFTSCRQSSLLLRWEEMKVMLSTRVGERQMEMNKQMLASCPKLLELSPANQTERSTQVLTRRLDKTLSYKFARRCKRESISVHSGCCALLNLAHAVLMAKADIKQDGPEGFCMTTLHAVDMRRYMFGSRNKLGAYVNVFPLEQWVDPQVSVSGEFWNLAVQFHKKYRERISDKAAFLSASSYYVLQGKGNSASNASQPSLYFVASNLGKVDKYFCSSVLSKDLSKSSTCDVHLVDLIQSTSRSGGTCMAHISCHVFRGKLTFCVDFDTEWLTEETVQNLLNIVEELATHLAGYL
ncbi:uncharacterized protein LOC143029882 [Oratosquilla oratoria]|uniref:uncharacterized protein LOC143029882 n=1 Tax=Oratosquilla oratoria TaxID=337810 RepID=UPI003F773470